MPATEIRRLVRKETEDGAAARELERQDMGEDGSILGHKEAPAPACGGAPHDIRDVREADGHCCEHVVWEDHSASTLSDLYPGVHLPNGISGRGLSALGCQGPK